MPDSYAHSKNDGKIHTRFTELNACVEGTAAFETMIRRKMTDDRGFTTPAMDFGKIRHEMLAEESRQTKRLPKKVLENFPHLEKHEASMVEEELAVEIFPGIILHSEPDFASLTTRFLADHKTMTGSEENMLNGVCQRKIRDYGKSWQHRVYSYQLMLRDHFISDFAYIGEVWNPDRTEFFGHVIHEDKQTVVDILETKPWLKKRCETLIKGINLYKKGILV